MLIFYKGTKKGGLRIQLPVGEKSQTALLKRNESVLCNPVGDFPEGEGEKLLAKPGTSEFFEAYDEEKHGAISATGTAAEGLPPFSEAEPIELEQAPEPEAEDGADEKPKAKAKRKAKGK